MTAPAVTWDVVTTQLAFGVEPVDARRVAPVLGPVRVLVEDHPSPVAAWRRFPSGTTLGDALPAVPRHPSGRYAVAFQRPGSAPARPTVFRVDDVSRRYVPRRVRVTLPTPAAIAAAYADPAVPDVTLAARVLRLHLYPGAAAATAGAGTVLRGLVRRGGDPVRWCRIRAERTGTGDVYGFAHGDDRGEFVLHLAPPADAIGMSLDPVVVRLVVGVPPTPVAPTDPGLTAVDPFWDLPVEDTALPPPPGPGDVGTGATFVSGSTTSTFVGPFTVAAGHARSVVLDLP